MKIKPLGWIILTSLFWIGVGITLAYQYKFNLFTNTFPCY